MSSTTPDLRELLNMGQPGRPGAIEQAMKLGDLLGTIIRSLTPTEAAAAVTSNSITMASTATQVYDVNATAGGTPGRKKLLIGNADTPCPTGYAVWNPADNTVRFSSSDAVTATNLTYATAAGATTSLGQRSLEQNDYV